MFYGRYQDLFKSYEILVHPQVLVELWCSIVNLLCGILTTILLVRLPLVYTFHLRIVLSTILLVRFPLVYTCHLRIVLVSSNFSYILSSFVLFKYFSYDNIDMRNVPKIRCAHQYLGLESLSNMPAKLALMLEMSREKNIYWWPKNHSFTRTTSCIIGDTRTIWRRRDHESSIEWD